MLEIEVRYRPVSWLPFTRNVDRFVPQNWSDLTPEQLIAIACLYKSGISDSDFLKTLSGLKRGILHKLSDFERYKLMEIFEFIGDQKPHHEFIIKKLPSSGSGNVALYSIIRSLSAKQSKGGSQKSIRSALRV